MNYGQARDSALRLIHQESIAGTQIPATYNNQQDYLDKIPWLINDAQLDIATTAKHIPASAILGELAYEEAGASRVYALPSDLWQFLGRGLLVPTRSSYSGETRYQRYNKVQLLGRNKLIVPGDLPEDSILEYYRYPMLLTANPGATTELDNVLEVHAAIPYYVAAHLVLLDDAFAYATLYNTYESKKSAMYELIHTEPNVVEDVIFGDVGIGYWG